MKGFLILIFFLIISTVCLGQTVKGTILHNETKEPLGYAKILSKVSNRGITADSTGSFQLKITKNDTLMISYVGFSIHSK